MEKRGTQIRSKGGRVPVDDLREVYHKAKRGLFIASRWDALYINEENQKMRLATGRFRH
jgi:hypothetical protein